MCNYNMVKNGCCWVIGSICINNKLLNPQVVKYIDLQRFTWIFFSFVGCYLIRLTICMHQEIQCLPHKGYFFNSNLAWGNFWDFLQFWHQDTRWHETGDMWQVICDRWYVTGDMWQVTHDMWQVTYDRLQVTHARWQVTHDRWHMTHSVGWTFSQVSAL